MSRILYRAKSARGDDVADFIEASSAAEAMSKLAGRGLKDIVLMQSPDIAAFNQPLPGMDPQVYARLRAEISEDRSLKAALGRVVRYNASLLAVGAAALAAGLWLRLLPLSLVGGALFVYPFAFFAVKHRHLNNFQALLKSYARGQWEEVRRLAPALRNATDNALLPWDIDVRLACVEAHQGRLDAAVASLEHWRPQIAAKAPGMFEARLASVYSAARDYDTFVRLMEQAAELGRQDPSRMVDVALAHARFGDLRRARDVLDSVDVKLLTPTGQKFVTYVKGILLVREGHPELAIPDLRTATDGFLELSLKSSAGWVALAMSSGYLAVALARCGQRDEAQAVIAPVLPILLVHAEKPLMDALQDDVLQRAA